MLSQAQTTALPAPVQMLALPAANTTLKKEPVIPLFSGISQAIPLLRADIKIEIPEAARNNKNVTPEILKNITNLAEAAEKYINSDESKINECKGGNDSHTIEKKDTEQKPKSDDPSAHSADARWQQRCQVLRLLKEGKMTKGEIAHVIGVHRNTVGKIANRLKQNPNLTNDDLREKHHGPYENPFHKIPLEVYLILRVILVTTLPIFFGLSYSAWSGPAIYELLTEFCKLDVKLSYVYYFLKSVNITSKFAQRINPSQDPKKVERFLKYKYPKILARAKLLGADILFFDEVHAFCGDHLRGFAPYGEPSIMAHTTAAMHSCKSFLVFVGLNGFIRVFEIDGSFAAEDFKKILRQLKNEFPDKKFILVGDNARVHHAKIVKRWLKHHKGGKMNFEMYFLPPYSPDLNPAERWNNIFKEYMRKHFCKDAKKIEEEARKFVETYKDDKKISEVKNLFKDKRCRYTLDEMGLGQKLIDRYKKLFKLSA